jgi:hypothetical protein
MKCSPKQTKTSMEKSIIVYKTWNKLYYFGVRVNLGKLGLVESVGVLNQANFNKTYISRGEIYQ